MNTALHFATGNNVRETPQAFFDALYLEFEFGCDVAALESNAKCPDYFGPDHEDPLRRDALDCVWPTDLPNWMNPPYGDEEFVCKPNCTKKRCVKRGHHCTEYAPGCYQFMEKAAAERLRGATTVCLVASRTDCAWFHDFVWDAVHDQPRAGVTIRFVRGRLKFDHEDNSAPFPSMLVIFNGDY
jgi:hypothetical protein